jgi:hypothetical protein
MTAELRPVRKLARHRGALLAGQHRASPRPTRRPQRWSARRAAVAPAVSPRPRYRGALAGHGPCNRLRKSSTGRARERASLKVASGADRPLSFSLFAVDERIRPRGRCSRRGAVGEGAPRGGRPVPRSAAIENQGRGSRASQLIAFLDKDGARRPHPSRPPAPARRSRTQRPRARPAPSAAVQFDATASTAAAGATAAPSLCPSHSSTLADYVVARSPKTCRT